MGRPSYEDLAKRLSELQRAAQAVRDGFERAACGSFDRWNGSTNDVDELGDALDFDPGDSELFKLLHPDEEQ